MSHPGGAPSKLTGEKINEAAAYVEPWREENIAAATQYIQAYVDGDKANLHTSEEDHYPTIEGLALELDVSRDTIYRWADDNYAFGKIVTRLLNKQAHKLQNGGLSKRYDSGMARLLLAKHGYIQRSENTDTINFNKDGKAGQYVED